MQNESAPTAPPSGSKKREQPLKSRLEEFARDHSTEPYPITTEKEAAEFLVLLSTVMRASEKTLSRPMEPAPGMEQFAKNYNKQQVLQIRKTANKFRRTASLGAALEFCREEFGHTPLEFHGIEITFPDAA